MNAKLSVLPGAGETPGRLKAEAILNALGTAVLVLDGEGLIQFLNGAGEQFFGASQSQLSGQPLDAFLPPDNPLFGLIAHVRKTGASVSEFGLELASPRIDRHFVNVQAAVLAERPGWVVVALLERSIADKIDRQMTHRNASRSATAMAAMLAHEVKNPLSGIRGAAQLLEQNATPDNRTLTRLICDETDRICALVDRMEVFSDNRPLERQAVNIHEVLERVRRLAQNGFGRKVRFSEKYDPSLPAVHGNRDHLVQIFLNLVKNACEATPEENGEVVLETAYRYSVRLAVPSGESPMQLPLVISVRDNGRGIPDDLADHLFDPFVTLKPKGSGLGLALVAKMVDDHGGVVEFDSRPGKTIFRVLLPMSPAPGNEKARE